MPNYRAAPLSRYVYVYRKGPYASEQRNVNIGPEERVIFAVCSLPEAALIIRTDKRAMNDAVKSKRYYEREEWIVSLDPL